MRCKPFFVFVFLFISLVSRQLVLSQESSVEQALDSLFSPSRAAERKTMGLLQRSFLDLVEEAQPKLEVAIVIDGTDSMKDSLSGIRNALDSLFEDLSRYKDNVQMQVVVYRDSGSPSGTVTFPLNISNNSFTQDIALVQAGIGRIKAETGAPFFHEQVDAGVHAAIHSLPWSNDENTSKWILLFGDAPPFDENWTDEKTNSERKYSTALLVTQARNKGVKISSILCQSEDRVKNAYEKSLGKTRRFMAELANETNGLMLDLSYDDIRKAIAHSSKKPKPTFQPLTAITKVSLQKLRDEANESKLVLSPNGQTRIAILPYMPLGDLSFDPEQREVQIAAELRMKFRQIPGVSVKTPRQIERIYGPLVKRGLKGNQMLAAIAKRLRVDYVLWGQMQNRAGRVEVSPFVFANTNQKPVPMNKIRANENQSAAGLIATRVLHAVTQPNSEMLAQVDALQPQLLRLVSTKPDAVNELITSFDALEQSLEYTVGSDESKRLLEMAKRNLDSAIEEDNTNPFAQYLNANYLFNVAQAKSMQGDTNGVRTLMKQFRTALETAYENRNSEIPSELQTEIKALYALLIQKNVAAAIKEYESLTEVDEYLRLNSARRAHWMLAGIYSGDWGVKKEFSNSQKMKYHLEQILAFWETSPEAEYIKKVLRWDAQQGESQFNHFPRSNDEVVKYIDA